MHIETLRVPAQEIPEPYKQLGFAPPEVLTLVALAEQKDAQRQTLADCSGPNSQSQFSPSQEELWAEGQRTREMIRRSLEQAFPHVSEGNQVLFIGPEDEVFACSMVPVGSPL